MSTKRNYVIRDNGEYWSGVDFVPTRKDAKRYTQRGANMVITKSDAFSNDVEAVSTRMVGAEKRRDLTKSINLDALGDVHHVKVVLDVEVRVHVRHEHDEEA